MTTAILIALILCSSLVFAGLRNAAAFAAARAPKAKLPSLAGIFSAKASIEWWKLIAIVLVVMLSRGGGEWTWPEWKLPTWNIGGTPAFVTDKLSVLIVEETAERGKYTSSQLDAILSTDAKSPKAIIEAKGGRFEVIDKDAADKLASSADWVKAAFAVKRDSLPWAVGSTPKRGFSAPLTSESELVKKVEGL